MEANIDDMTGEVAGYVMERLLEIGVLDVFYTPIYMKKNRPAMKLSVLCKEERIEEIEQILFCETTTLGIRTYKAARVCMTREWFTVQTTYGDVRIKKATYGDIVKCAPEYEDCKRLAQKEKVPVQRIYQEALKHADI